MERMGLETGSEENLFNLVGFALPFALAGMHIVILNVLWHVRYEGFALVLSGSKAFWPFFVVSLILLLRQCTTLKWQGFCECAIIGAVMAAAGFYMFALRAEYASICNLTSCG